MQRPTSTNEGSKRVIPHKDVPFGGLNHVPLNFPQFCRPTCTLHDV